MIKGFAVIFSFLFATSTAFSSGYTREELEQKSKPELIGIILYLQGGGSGGGCKTYDPLAGETGSILIPRNHPGYNDHGTLSWPNGEVFMLRHSGYNDDKSLFYQNGYRMILSHTGYNDHNTIYWPNGQTMLLAHNGYNDDGSVFRSDGSIWLRRHRGYGDDLQRFGMPVHNEGDVRARLTDENSVHAVTTVTGEGWSVKVTLNGANASVLVEECFH